MLLDFITFRWETGAALVQRLGRDQSRRYVGPDQSSPGP